MTREDRLIQKKPTALSSALSELITKRGLARSNRNDQLKTYWEEVAGERITASTQIGPLKHGTLTIFVGNSALLGELVSFHQYSLLDALQKKVKQKTIKQLKFRLKNSIGK